MNTLIEFRGLGIVNEVAARDVFRDNMDCKFHNSSSLNKLSETITIFRNTYLSHYELYVN